VSFSGIYGFRSFVRVEIRVQEMKEDGKAKDDRRNVGTSKVLPSS
jgi:hypothetical protein